MLEDEQKLVKKAKDGEVEAFGLLYDHYLPKIYRFVLLKVNQREEAEDLTHQVFLKAWESIEQYDFRGYSFGSWLYQIARNAAVDYFRSYHSNISMEDAPDIPDDKNLPSQTVESKIVLENLIKSIGELKEIEREVIIMRFVEDLPPKDVAKIVGKSEGAVKIIQHRALKSLRKIIEEDSK